MKVKKYITYLPVAAISLALTSCNDFLNKYPDSRMDLKNPTEVSQLLVSAYPQAHPAYLTEMYSDNTDEQLHSTWSAFDRFQEQAYQWKDIDDVSIRRLLTSCGQHIMQLSQLVMRRLLLSIVCQIKMNIRSSWARLCFAERSQCSSCQLSSVRLTTRLRLPTS